MTRKILVIQITRVGDILQTTPLLRGLREANPDAFLAVLVNKRFEKAIVGNPDVDEVYMLDADFLTQWNGQGSEGFMEGHSRLQELCMGLRGMEFDEVVNASFNDVSATLATLIRGAKTVGFMTRADGAIDAPDFVSRYVHSQVQSSRFPQPHIADILQCLGGIRPASRAYRVPLPTTARGRLERLDACAMDEVLIGIQPGSNNEEKGLPADFVGRLVNGLAAPKRRFVILGSPQEREIFEIVSKHTGAPLPLMDLTGTDWEDLARVLLRLKILISGDTAPAHLATALSTRVLMIFRGISHYSLTGPYGEGHWALDPPGSAESRAGEQTLPPHQAVVRLAQAVLNEAKPVIVSDMWKGWIPARSTYDEEGWLSFETFAPRESADTEEMGRLLRNWWKRALIRELNRSESTGVRVEAYSATNRLSRPIPAPLVDETCAALTQADSILGEAVHLLESGGDHEALTLDKADDLFARLADASPGRFLRSFLEFLRTNKSLALSRDPSISRRGLAAAYSGVRHSLKDFGSFVRTEAA